MRYIIGIDQGSTKTHVALAEEGGRILGAAKAPGGEHHHVGLPVQTGFIRQAVEALNTPFDWADVVAAGGGLTGIDFPDEDLLFEDYLLTLFPNAKTHCENDVIATLKGGSLCTYGAAICCGTGANVVVIAPGGESFIYGMHLEKELMGSSALRHDGIWAVIKSDAQLLPPTMLTEKVLSFYNMPPVLDLLIAQTKGGIDFKDYGMMPKVICECAVQGDKVAIGILERMGFGFAETVTAQARRFGMTGLAFDLVLSGSVFKGPGTHLNDAVRRGVLGVCPKANVIDARYEPVVGGVIMALEQIYGETLPADVLDRVGRSAADLGLIRRSEV
jgi:N-acetylglucosamine kinase-like BadF-type ATPase